MINTREARVLKATAVADKNYRFAGWSDGNTSATRELQANANLDIVARFDPVLYGVTFTDPMNGSLKVFANGVEVKNDAEFFTGDLIDYHGDSGCGLYGSVRESEWGFGE